MYIKDMECPSHYSSIASVWFILYNNNSTYEKTTTKCAIFTWIAMFFPLHGHPDSTTLFFFREKISPLESNCCFACCCWSRHILHIFGLLFLPGVLAPHINTTLFLFPDVFPACHSVIDQRLSVVCLPAYDHLFLDSRMTYNLICNFSKINATEV